MTTFRVVTCPPCSTWSTALHYMSKHTEVTAVDRPGISTDYSVHHCVANKNNICSFLGSTLTTSSKLNPVFEINDV
jgi:hypothetical protein